VKELPPTTRNERAKYSGLRPAKQAPRVGRRHFRDRFGRDSADLRELIDDQANVSWLVGLATERNRSQIRTIGFGQDPIEGKPCGGLPKCFGSPKGQVTGERHE